MCIDLIKSWFEYNAVTCSHIRVGTARIVSLAFVPIMQVQGYTGIEKGGETQKSMVEFLKLAVGKNCCNYANQYLYSLVSEVFGVYTLIKVQGLD